MRIVLQRVRTASVRIDEKPVGKIGQGLLLLVGIHRDDNTEKADFLAEKCASLRIFEDPAGKMNLSVCEVNGGALVVSQFTLYGDSHKGKRPSFSDAAPPDLAEPLYEFFVHALRKRIGDVQTGVFRAMMQVELVNDGPVTLILEK